MSDDEVSIEGGLFEEPDGFLPSPPQSHFATYKRKTPKAHPEEITMKLVGKSPLWGHLLWNAGIYTADYLDRHAEELVRGKRVLELGAAAALPSLICAVNGAAQVVATDYPDPDLIDHIKFSFDNLEKRNSNHGDNGGISEYKVCGYIWGNNVAEAIYGEDKRELHEDEKFDLIILSDLIFNHTEHHRLLKACRESCKHNGKCLVVFSPHRAKLLQEDLSFFATCTQYQFEAEKIEMVNMTPMFVEDEETAEVRSRVYAYFLIPTWKIE
ncbi:uncharacterized protein LODBEIA_P15330 [Lodderomyces beijingensis]|uniref:Protein N-terminal and lysine N-methyltransferase EFM7 n=1 Tax=Lodderomyces beijingensis TaxID=1775926 RepID=A0ABP0ZHF3_9ASCO